MRRSTTLPRLLLSLTVGLVTSTAAADGFTVSGRVLTESGEPLPGARVAVTETRAGYGMGLRWLEGQADPETVARAVTGADGWYRLELPGPGRWRTLVSAPGHVPMERWLEPFLGEERLATVSLPRDAGLLVTVVDERGEPVPGARVWNQPAEGSRRWQEQREAGWKPPFATALADERGRLRLPRLEGEGLRIRAWHPERLASPEVASHGEPVRLTLPAGVPATVEVRDARGRPAPGAVVRWGQVGWTAGLTGDDGRVTLTLPAEGRTRIMAQTADGHWGEVEVVTPPAPETVPVVRLVAPPTVRGRVVDADTGAAVAGAFVYTAGGSQTVVSDRTGSYELWLPSAARAYWVRAAAPGYREGGERVDPAAPPREVYVALTGARRVAGRVVTESGEPVAGATVWVHPARSPTIADLFKTQGPQPTDAVGGFAFRAIPGDTAIEVLTVAAGLAPRRLKIAPQEPSTGLVVELDRGATLAARIVSTSGEPVPGARVSLTEGEHRGGFPRAAQFTRIPTWIDPPLEGQSDDQGRLRLTLLPAGTFVALVEAADYPDRVLRNLEIPEDGEVDLGDVVLQEGASIPGVVVDPEGRPVADAQVRVLEGLPLARPDAARPTATSGQDGRFELPDLPAGGRFRLEVTAPGWVAAKVGDVPAPPEEPVEVVLERGGRVFGQVVDGEGRPVTERLLVLRPADGSHDFSRVVRQPEPTDDEGGFDLGEVAAGEYLLQVYTRGSHRPLEHGPLTVASGQQVGPLRLVADGAADDEQILVEGVVVRPDGLPAIGTRVELRGEIQRAADDTDAAGRFELRIGQDGPAVLEARHEEHGRAERQVTVSRGLAPLRLELVPGAEISGHVVGPEGNPVADAFVVVSPVDPQQTSTGLSTRSGPGGAFSVGALATGSYQLQVSAQGWPPWHSPEPLSLTAGETRDVQVELEAGTTLSGHILGLEPHELAAVEVSAVPLEASGPERRHHVTALVDHRGAYRAEGLVPGPWSVRAHVYQPARQIEETVTILPGQRLAELDLVFGDGYSLVVNVHSRGEPLAANVTVRGSSAVLFGRTDADGRFRFADLAAGDYELEVRLEGFRQLRRLTVEGDEEVVVEVTASRVTGVLIGPFGDPVFGAQVRLIPHEGTSGEVSVPATTSGPDGRFRLSYVPEGSYRLSAHEGRTAVVEPVQVVGPEVDLGVLQMTEEGDVELLLRGPDGLLAGSFRVASFDAQGRLVGTTFETVGADGLLKLTGVPREVRRVAVMGGRPADRLAPAEVTVVVGDGPSTPIPATLPRAGELKLRVPVEIARSSRLSLTDAAGRPPLPLLLDGRGDVPLGRAESVLHLSPGRWTLTLTAGDGRAWSAEVSLQPGETTELALGEP